MVESVKSIEHKERLLSLLAKKLDTRRQEVRFLFGETSLRDLDIVIPDIRTRVLK